MSFQSSAASDTESGAFGQGYQNNASYNDGDDEYTQCHTEVYDSIKTLTGLFGTISRQAQAVGTNKDGSTLRSQLKANIDSALQQVKTTQSTIRKLASLCNNTRAGKERKQKVDKLTQDFDKFTEKLRELVKIASDKMDSAPVSVDKGKDSQSLYSRSQANNQSEDEEEKMLLDKQQDLAQLDDDLDFQDSMIRDRDAQIRVIQGQMVQVNDIFRDLARLVEDQGEMIDNIQTNIVSASQNVEAGLKEVKEADKSQQSSRKKLCFLAIFVTVLLAIVVIVVVVLVKK